MGTTFVLIKRKDSKENPYKRTDYWEIRIFVLAASIRSPDKVLILFAMCTKRS